MRFSAASRMTANGSDQTSKVLGTYRDATSPSSVSSPALLSRVTSPALTKESVSPGKNAGSPSVSDSVQSAFANMSLITPPREKKIWVTPNNTPCSEKTGRVRMGRDSPVELGLLKSKGNETVSSGVEAVGTPPSSEQKLLLTSQALKNHLNLMMKTPEDSKTCVTTPPAPVRHKRCSQAGREQRLIKTN